MEAFATVQDLQMGWRTLDTDEQAVAGELLLRATAILSAALAKAGVAVDPEDEVQAINLKTVTCGMVRRSMNAGFYEGLSSASQTIGSTTASIGVSNPDGALYVTRGEMRTLGIGGGRVGWASTVEWSEVG